MAEYKLDSTVRYARTHEWVRIEEGVAVVGISDAAQDMLSDVVYVELPAEGAAIQAGAEVAVVESVKAAEDIIAPISGVVVAVNRELENTPELVNQQPYAAWFFKVAPHDSLNAELDALMSPDDYAAFVAESSH
jgi:glycine cleavage system H protein